MAPETHFPLLEPLITSAPEIIPETTAEPNANIAAPPALAPKRQRRPSVRLGEIGDQRDTSRLYNHLALSWRVPKEPSRTSKARTATNLANGGDNSGNQRRGKAKRGSTKRLRSDHAPKPIDENGSERFMNFDHNHDHNRNSHTHSVDENGNHYWHVDPYNGDRIRGLEIEGGESESREQRKNEGVLSWLFELRLSRYAPIFEIHEVDDDLLPLLTLEDLKDMGISAVGSRRKMFTAIQKLRKGVP
ncbi:SAM domain family protein [Trifolium pratense]|uniref:SAM domain family protein n=1 Tax=Trifolium pratense TaxID=57577 RepID=A0A2K3MP61_TRIPR|nr:SAM domain family protein [Trifolium pratense]